MIASNPSVWSLSEDLADYIVATFFAQPRSDSTALIRAKLPDGHHKTWLYTNEKYASISHSDYDLFKKAAKLRGGASAVELCEFTIEQVHANGDITLFYWRHSDDDSGKGDRLILSKRDGAWTIAQKLGGWEASPFKSTTD